MTVANLAHHPSLDICFLLDATGSMGPMIQAVKNQIRTMVRDIERAHPSCQVRLAVVAYRDYEDDPRTESLPFTRDVQVFESFLGALEAKGGGDPAEDVISGLQKACTLEWASVARLLVHFADAPCHGDAYHTPRVYDKYPQGDREGRKTQTWLRALAHVCRVHTYQFMHLNQTTHKMLETFRREMPEPVEWFLEQDVALQDRSRLSELVYMGSIRSMERSAVEDSAYVRR